MSVLEPVPTAFGAQPGDGSISLAIPTPCGSTQYDDRRRSPAQHEWRLAGRQDCGNISDDIAQCLINLPSCLATKFSCSALPRFLQCPAISKQVASALSACTQYEYDAVSTSTTPAATSHPNPPSPSSVAPLPTSPRFSSHPLSTSTNSDTLTPLPSSSQTIANNVPTGGDTPSRSPPLFMPSSSGGGNVGASQPLPFPNPQSPSAVSSTPTASVSRSLASSPSPAQPPDSTQSLPYLPPAPGGPKQSASAAHRLNAGAIVGITLGALAVVLGIALATFFLARRRARRRSRRVSFKSPWKRLEERSYDDGQRRPVSSIWSWFSSVHVDPDLEPKREPIAHSPDFFRLAEKDADPARSGSGAYTPRLSPSPCPSPAPAETRPLARDMSSVHSLRLHDGLPHPNIQIPIPSAPAASSTSELLALAGTDFRGAVESSNRAYGYGGLERKASDVSDNSYTTARSGDVQSVEAL